MTQDTHAAQPQRLTDGDVQDLKPQGWWGDDGKIFRVFEFENYQDGVDFAVWVSELAEAQDHHPKISISYKKVKVTYTTYETTSISAGVTELDLQSASAVNDLFEVSGKSTPYLKTSPNQ